MLPATQSDNVTVQELLFGKLDPRSIRAIWRAARNGDQSSKLRQVIGISASFTVDPLVPYLGGTMSALGNAPEMHLADYNRLIQTCLDPLGAFSGVSADAIVLLFRLEDLATDKNPASILEAFGMLKDALRRLRESHNGAIIVSVPPRSTLPADFRGSFARPLESDMLWQQVFRELAELAETLDQFFTVDLDAIVAELGIGACRDIRTEMMYRKPFTEPFYLALAQRLARILRLERAASKKCLVLDCDNTLWGGVIGDDGISGIALSDDFPGRAFREFQRTCKALKESGIFLAVSSKNDLPNVLEVFRDHSAMLLKEEDISVFAVNWEPKSENLRQISQHLNIGMDSLVFVDDSSFEIEEVRTRCPEVTCLQVPGELAELPDILHRNAYLFDRLAVTADDRERVNRMGSEQMRQQLSATLDSGDFLKSLDLRIDVFEPRAADLARVAQLVNKTNQFNLTTRRYTQGEIQSFLDSENHRLYAMTVTDRFGEYGLVGVAVTVRVDAARWAIDTFLMSCRVLKRGAETCLLSAISQDAASMGAETIYGFHTATPKNAMCAELYAEHGFHEAAAAEAPVFENGDGTRCFGLDLANLIAVPDFVTFRHVANVDAAAEAS
jgi:FkbH-like protein